jgi:hypothetical protein
MADSERLQELQEELTKIRRLKETDGYEWLVKIGEAQVQSRLGTIILVSPESADDMVKKNFALGECAGIKLMQSIADVYYEQIRDEIQNLTKGND